MAILEKSQNPKFYFEGHPYHLNNLNKTFNERNINFEKQFIRIKNKNIKNTLKKKD